MVNYAATGRVEQALETAGAILTEDAGAMHSWSHLVEALKAVYGAAAIELLLPITLLDETGEFLEPLIKTYPSNTVADFCSTYLDRGGQIIETIRVGLMAAAMAGNETAFAAILPSAVELEPRVRGSLAERIAIGGRPDLAAGLQAEPAATR